MLTLKVNLNKTPVRPTRIRRDSLCDGSGGGPLPAARRRGVPSISEIIGENITGELKMLRRAVGMETFRLANLLFNCWAKRHFSLQRFLKRPPSKHTRSPSIFDWEGSLLAELGQIKGKLRKKKCSRWTQTEQTERLIETKKKKPKKKQ